MLDFTDIATSEMYAGYWVAFEVNEADKTVLVLSKANNIHDLVNSDEVAGKEYVIHKF